MISYTLYGGEGCAKCKIVEKMMAELGIEYQHKDVTDADDLAEYHWDIAKYRGDGNKLPGLIVFLQGDAAIEYLKKIAAEKKA